MVRPQTGAAPAVSSGASSTASSDPGSADRLEVAVGDIDGRAGPRVDAPASAGSGSATRALGPGEMIGAGTAAGPWRIGAEIGRGGFGIVYEAHGPQTGGAVAIKEYMPRHLARRLDGRMVVALSLGVAAVEAGGEGAFELGLRGFLDEARLLARYQHPGLVHVSGCWRENGTAYLAMPLYAGITLKRLVETEHRQIDQAWLLRMLDPLLGALELLHADGSFHRDIAPDNILIPDAGGAVLLDLGAARHLIADQARALTVMLKPGFAPIEQYANDPGLLQGPWTDVYALGAVLYFAITTRTPPASAARAMRDSLPTLAGLAPPGYSQAFLRAIDRALSIRPEERPPSMAAFRTALTSADAATGPTTATIAGRRLGGAPAEGGAPDPLAGPATGDGGMLRRTLRPDERAAVLPGSAPPSDDRKGLMRRLGAAGLVLTVGFGSAWLAATGPAPVEDVRPAATGPALNARAPTPPVAGTGPTVGLPPVEGLTPPPALETATLVAIPQDIPTGAAATAGADAAARAPLAQGRLLIAVRPWAEILIDGHPRGISPPRTSLRLPVGPHVVELRNPGAPAYRVEIEIIEGRTTSIQHRF